MEAVRWAWWRRPEPELVPVLVSELGRDARGRFYDGDRVVPPVDWPGWADAQAVRPADPWRGPTVVLPAVGGPLLTRGQRWRADQAGWTDPRR